SVTLSVSGAGGMSEVVWPLEIFEMEHVTQEFPEGNMEEYVVAARRLDRGKLQAAPLRELAYFMSEAADPAESIAIGKESLQRFADAPKLEAARLRRLMA